MLQLAAGRLNADSEVWPNGTLFHSATDGRIVIRIFRAVRVRTLAADRLGSARGPEAAANHTDGRVHGGCESKGAMLLIASEHYPGPHQFGLGAGRAHHVGQRRRVGRGMP
jgi:hypothetical protein